MNNKSKKRKDLDAKAPELGREMKKVKRNDNDTSSDDPEQPRYGMKKNEVTSIEKSLKDSEGVYGKFVEQYEGKENDQNKLIHSFETENELHKQEEGLFLKNLRQAVTVMKGEEKVGKMMENLEKECAQMKEKLKNHERLKQDLEKITKENEELRKALEESKVSKESKGGDDKQAFELKKQLEKLGLDLKDKERKEKSLQSIVELYYSMTNLKISTDLGSQEPVSEFHCVLKSDNNKESEVEFRLKDMNNAENELEYNPIKCKLSKKELEAHPYLEEEIFFDLNNLKSFFKTVFGAVNKEDTNKKS